MEKQAKSHPDITKTIICHCSPNSQWDNLGRVTFVSNLMCLVFCQSTEPTQPDLTRDQSSQHAPHGNQLHSSSSTSYPGLPPLLSHS